MFNVTITCPNEGCEESFIRKEEEDHLDVCPKTVIQCPYLSIGCNIKFKREELEEHKQTATQNHLDLAMGRLVNLQEKKQYEKKQREKNQHAVIALEGCVDFNSSKQTSDFYIFPLSYKMCLIVFCSDPPTHLSLILRVKFGRYDIFVGSPCQKLVNVTLLNQLSDCHHLTGTVTITRETSDNGYSRFMGKWENFIALSSLEGENYSYLQDSTLYFRVSLAGSSKEWLTLTKHQ